MRSPTPRTWLVLLVALGLVIVGVVVLTVGSGDTPGGAAGNSEPGTMPVVTDSLPGSDDTLTTSAPTEPSTTSTTTSTTVAPPTTKAPPPKPRTPPGGGVASGCSSYPLTQINGYRSAVGQPPLSAMSNAKACAWAEQLAINGTLSHGNTDCGYQVVGYYGQSGGGTGSAPANIITGWYNSRSGDPAHPKHYEILISPAVSRMGLAFVTVTYPNGSWRVYGVGNLC